MGKYAIIFFILCFIKSVSQITVDYNHSRKGEAIWKNYYTFLNDEYGGINIFLDSEYDKFEKGNLKLKKESTSISAYIKFNTHKVNIKTNPSTTSKTYKASDISYFTTIVDSFFVVDKIKVADKLIDKPSLVQHIATIEDDVFAMYYEMTFNGSLKKKFFIKKDKEDPSRWEKVKLKDDPEKKVFMGYRAREKYIDKKELSIDEFLNILKIEEYSNHIKNTTFVYFDKQWREVRNKSNAIYKATVQKNEDELFILNFQDINSGMKKFEIKLSSLNPFKKTGKMSLFDNEEKLFSTRFYDDDKLKSIKFYENEKSIFALAKLAGNDEQIKKEGTSFVYQLIGETEPSLSDNEIIKWNLNKEVLVYDLSYKKAEKVFVSTDNKKCYNTNQLDFPRASGNIQTSLKNFIYESQDFQSKKYTNDLEGTVLIALDIDYKGRVIGHKILNKLGNKMDDLVKTFCEKRLVTSATYRMRFKGIKLEDKEVVSKFILPITFEHRQFYKTFSRPNYNFHDQWFWHQQMMWQQQWHQQQLNIPPPNLPSFNRF